MGKGRGEVKNYKSLYELYEKVAQSLQVSSFTPIFHTKVAIFIIYPATPIANLQ